MQALFSQLSFINPYSFAMGLGGMIFLYVVRFFNQGGKIKLRPKRVST